MEGLKLVHFFIFSYLTLFPPKCETKETFPYNYTLSTNLLKSMPVSDPIARKFFESLHYSNDGADKEHQNYINSAQFRTKAPKLVKNLYSTLKYFINQHCLIVLNNFEDVDIHPEIDLRLITRQFEIGYGVLNGYIDDWIWIPKELVPKLNGNFSREPPKHTFFNGSYKECQLFNYMYSIWPVDKNSFHCLDFQSFNFIKYQCIDTY